MWTSHRYNGLYCTNCIFLSLYPKPTRTQNCLQFQIKQKNKQTHTFCIIYKLGPHTHTEVVQLQLPGLQEYLSRLHYWVTIIGGMAQQETLYASSQTKLQLKNACIFKQYQKSPKTILSHCILFLVHLSILSPRSRHFTPLNLLDSALHNKT